MDNRLLKQVKPPKPVSIVRAVDDVIIIEGVRYAGDFFRMHSYPNPEYLYALRRDGETVTVTEIHNASEAQVFFLNVAEDASAMNEDDPHPALPQMGEHNLGEDDKENENAL